MPFMLRSLDPFFVCYQLHSLTERLGGGSERQTGFVTGSSVKGPMPKAYLDA